MPSIRQGKTVRSTRRQNTDALKQSRRYLLARSRRRMTRRHCRSRGRRHCLSRGRRWPPRATRKGLDITGRVRGRTGVVDWLRRKVPVCGLVRVTAGSTRGIDTISVARGASWKRGRCTIGRMGHRITDRRRSRYVG